MATAEDTPAPDPRGEALAPILLLAADGVDPLGGTDKRIAAAKTALSDKLRKLAEANSSTTKVLASWVVALAAFGLFGFAQVQMQLDDSLRKLKELNVAIPVLEGAINSDVCSFARADVRSESCNGYATEAQTLLALHTCAELNHADADAPISKPQKPSEKAGVFAKDGTPLAIAASDPSENPTLSPKARCAVLVQKRARLKTLEEQRDKLFGSVNEIPLKTPLFETKVRLQLAPLVEMALLLAATAYLYRKRREAVAGFAECTEAAAKSDVPITAINAAIKDSFGSAPLWLLPFPIGLSRDLQVTDALGRSARGAGAWVCVLAYAMAAILVTIFCFNAAASLEIASLFRGLNGGTLRKITLDAWFLAAFGLAGGIALLALLIVLPWTPHLHLPSSPALVWTRRGVLGLFALGVPPAFLGLAIHAGRESPVRRYLSDWGHDGLARQWFSKVPRVRTRRRWQSRWTVLPATSSLVPAFVARSEQERAGKAKAKPKATGRSGTEKRGSRAAKSRVPIVRYIVQRLAGDQRFVFGLPWRQFEIKTGAPTEETNPDAVLLVTVPGTALTKQARGICKSATEPGSNSQDLPKLSYAEASVSLEVAALTLVAHEKADEALDLLLYGASSILSLPNSLRIWDLAAAIALSHKKLDRLEDLARKLECTVGLASTPGGSPTVGSSQVLAKYAEADRRKRKRKRKLPPGADKRYMHAEVTGRVDRWRSSDSRWRRKWTLSDGASIAELWKLSLLDPVLPPARA